LLAQILLTTGNSNFSLIINGLSKNKTLASIQANATSICQPIAKYQQAQNDIIAKNLITHYHIMLLLPKT